MKRNTTLLKAIMTVIEDSSKEYENLESIGALLVKNDPALSFEAIRHHLALLVDRGLLTGGGNSGWRLTADGHDFLESIPAEVPGGFRRLEV
jgi:repressor of nif and glnA expression